MDALNNQWTKPDLESVAKVFKRIVEKVDSSLAGLPDDRHITLKFEDLEKNPYEAIQEIYKYFGLKFTEDYSKNLKSFLDEIKSYKKNSYSLTEEDQNIINAELDGYMKKYNYH